MMKNCYALLCLVVCTFFVSCDDDEKETIPPVVTITSPDASGKLFGTITINAQATDESGISSVKILIDDIVLDEYADGEVSHQWNTESTTDGQHTIKVIATDAVGNEGSATLAVEVFNDKKAPVVTIASPVTQPFIKSTITIQGSVTDDSSLESIKIYVDDALLTTVTNSTSYTFDWDTKAVPDGNHTIKVTATDNRGNQSSATSQVEVYNYFVTINVVNPQVPSHVSIWYLISRNDGTLIQAKPYVPGETKIRFETPDNFNADERYVFSTFQYIGKYQNYLIQAQYSAEVGFKPGETTVSPRHIYSSGSSSDVLGYHTLTVNNAAPNEHLFMTGVNMWSTSAAGGALSINMGFYDFNNNSLNPMVALLRGADEAPRFKNFTGLQIGGTTLANFDDFTAMVGNKYTAIPDATYTYDYVYGVSNSKYNESIPVWNFTGFTQPNKAHYLYNPAGAYPEYIFAAQEGSSVQSNYYQHIGSQAPATILRSNAAVSTFTKQQRTLTLQTTGTYDILSVSGNMNKDINGELNVFYWSVQFPDGAAHSVTLPQLPAALDNYNFPDLSTVSFSNAGFTDFGGINGYQEYKDFLATHPSESYFSIVKDHVYKSTTLPNTGGRLKDESFRQTLKIDMENMKRAGLIRNYSVE